ncbi:hypothetical protein FOCC_FOCC003127, partial [Frankliniella occidentalis]
MVIYLPLLFADGNPTSLERATAKWLNNLKEVICRCYEYHGCEHVLRFCSRLAELPPGFLRYKENSQGFISIYNRASNKLIVTFKKKNQIYDRPVGSPAKPSLLPRKPKGPPSDQHIEDIYLCNYCDEEFTSAKNAIHHEGVCKGKIDQEDQNHEVDQVSAMRYFGLGPTESNKKEGIRNTSLRLTARSYMSIPVSSPLGRKMSSNVAPLKEVDKMEYIQKLEGCCGSRKFLDEPKRTRKFGVVHHRALRLNKQARLLLKKCKRAVVLLERLPLLDPLALHAAAVLDYQNRLNSPICEEPVHNFIDLTSDDDCCDNKWLNNLKEVICRCYEYHGCEHVLRFCSRLAELPPGFLRYKENSQGFISIYNRASNKLIVTFKKKNQIYDRPVGSPAKPSLLPRKPKGPPSDQHIEDIYLCNYCDEEFTSAKNAIHHEGVCKGKIDQEDQNHEVDQVSAMRYFGLGPTESNKKEGIRNTSLRLTARSYMSIPVSSPLGRKMSSNVAPLKEVDKMEYIQKLEGCCGSRKFLDEPKRTRKFGVVHHRALRLNKQARLLLKKCKRAVVLLERLPLLDPLALHAAAVLDYQNRLNSPICEEPVHNFIDLT